MANSTRRPRIRPDKADALTDVLHKCGFTWAAAATISEVLEACDDPRLHPDTVADNLLRTLRKTLDAGWETGSREPCECLFCPRMKEKTQTDEQAAATPARGM